MSGELYSYSQPVMATAVPYGESKSPPIAAAPAPPESFNSESNIYDSGSGPWVQDDAIERSSNIFNQVGMMVQSGGANIFFLLFISLFFTLYVLVVPHLNCRCIA